MLEIIVPQQRTQRQIDAAETKRVEFRPSVYTSGSANLDNMVALRKAVILCATHARKFDAKRAKYRAHPDKAMRRVIGNCDYCRSVGLSSLFLNEVDAYVEQQKFEKYKRAIEYGQLVTS